MKGIRVTDEETMDVVEMVLGGKINTEIVGLINHYGGKAVGLSGKDANLIKAKSLKIKGSDMGFAGEVESVNPKLIKTLEDSNFIPVIAPIGYDDKGKSYNINADTVAGADSIGLKGRKINPPYGRGGVLDKHKKAYHLPYHSRGEDPHEEEDSGLRNGSVSLVLHRVG